MKVLITGAFGLIGGRLAAHLSQVGNEVYLGSRDIRDKPNWLTRGDVVQINWTDQGRLENVCQGMDVVIHCAGLNASECLSNPKKAIEINGMATGRLAVAAQKASVAKFFYMSTAHVYSSDLQGLITENNETANTHPYATSNILGEQAVMKRHSATGMQTFILRLSNSFGVPMDIDTNCWMLVLNDFCRQAASDRQLVIRSPSETSRNFITLTDVCLAIHHLISLRGKSKRPTICNLGDKTRSLLDMASIISEIYESEKGISLPIVLLSKDSKPNSHLDFQSIFFQRHNWQPKSNFKVELSELISYCETNFESSFKK
jgi:UDP-glucose 4-epimerase